MENLKDTAKKTYQSIFISHGGGPLPLLGDQAHQQLVDNLQSIALKLKKPRAIIMVSAHWETSDIQITASSSPELTYDYYGFPPAAYSIEYPCAGAPDIAGKIHQQLKHAGLDSTLNNQRGFDHGMFVPMKILFPAADIPCVQVSLHQSLDPQYHILIGKALQSLSDDNILLIGSGFSFHNMQAFFTPDDENSRQLNNNFESWLKQTCCDTGIDEKARGAQLCNWEKAPGARYCHPREEHLLPLHVCYGYAQKPCSEKISVEILNKQASLFLW